jgi:hypothetical protein
MSEKSFLTNLRLSIARAAAEIKGQKFYATIDGVVVEPEGGELKPGVKLMVKDPATGEMLPAPTGEHTLDSGEIVVVGADGMITEIKPKEADPAADPAKDPAEMNAPPAPPAQNPSALIEQITRETRFSEAVSEEVAKAIPKITDAIKATFTELLTASKAETDAVKAEFAAYKTENETALKDIQDLVEKIAEQPSAQSFKEVKKKTDQTEKVKELTPTQQRIVDRGGNLN